MDKPQGSAKRLLLVDDDPDTCEVIRLLLEDSGYSVATAESIAAVIELLEADVFDFYILDYWLPDGMGVDLCRRLRALYPETPIIFHSGVARESEIQKATAAGADYYLIKPCEFDEMQSTIEKLLLQGSGGQWRDARGSQASDAVG